MATSNAKDNTAVILEFELGSRKCVWNPQIDGFAGLSALLETPVFSGEVNSLKQPELYNAVISAINAGILVKKNSTVKKAQRKLGVDNKTAEIPNLDSRVSKFMLESSTDEVINHISRCNDISELQIMIEKESLAKNKAGRPRDNVKDLLKQKIREIDTAVL